MKNILLILTISVLLSGCYIGAASYEVFEKNRNLSIGHKLYSGLENRKQFYTEEFDIYPVEHPKGCIFGYITRKNDRNIIDWIILSGKEYCNARQAWGI